MINPADFINNWQQQQEAEDHLVAEIMQAQETDVYAFGRNEQTELLLKHVSLNGIIDDYYEQEQWHGVPVYKSTELSGTPLIINCVLSISPTKVWQRINQLTNKGLSYYNFHRFDHARFPLPEVLEQRKQDLLKHTDRWQNIWQSLDDDASKELLNNYICFSSTADYRFYKTYQTALSDQYFDPFMAYQGEIFVDAGGYIGDTSQEFIKRVPDYKRIYLFEPSKQNIEQAKLNLANDSNVYFIEKGVSSEAGTCKFNEGLGSSSSVNESGAIEIELTTIDQEIDGEVSLIKMDLEGFEAQALTGAKQKISQYNPKLAIAVYHKGDDIWQLTEQILSYNSNYRLRLRQYTEGWSETVMYFMPKT